jgi:hypothetical protein
METMNSQTGWGNKRRHKLRHASDGTANLEMFDARPARPYQTGFSGFDEFWRNCRSFTGSLNTFRSYSRALVS